MTILRYPQHMNRDTLQPSDRIVIPTGAYPTPLLRVAFLVLRNRAEFG
jgi:hypothetical protein